MLVTVSLSNVARESPHVLSYMHIQGRYVIVSFVYTAMCMYLYLYIKLQGCNNLQHMDLEECVLVSREFFSVKVFMYDEQYPFMLCRLTMPPCYT